MDRVGITPAARPFPITLAKAIKNLERDRKLLAEDIPQGSKKAFMARVKEAVRIYYSLSHPGSVSRELASLARSLRRGDGDIEKAFNRLSRASREVLEQFGPLPNFTDPEGKDAAIEILWQRLIIGEYWKQQKSQRRRVAKVTGTRNRGRPQDSPELVLVAFLAVAFVRFTGQRSSRSWGVKANLEDGLCPFEDIVVGVLIALQIDDQHNANNLVRNHIRAREIGK